MELSIELCYSDTYQSRVPGVWMLKVDYFKVFLHSGYIRLSASF